VTDPASSSILDAPPDVGQKRRRVPVAVQRLLLVAAIIIAWWLAALGTPAYILPGPDVVVRAMIRLAQTESFLTDVGATFGRVATGFILSIVIGVPLGILFGSNRPLGDFFEPILPILNTVSAAIWAIFALMWFGLSDAATVFVVFMTAMPLIITNTWAGTRNVNPELIEVAESLRFGRTATLAKIYLPSILPYLFSGARLAFGFGWRVSLVAETLGAASGIGYRVRQAADLFQADQVFAWTIFMIVVMAFIELGLLRPLELWLFRWQRIKTL
jgi:NitT/TauT family transport system permease protein